jgi:hypothetical protein
LTRNKTVQRRRIARPDLTRDMQSRQRRLLFGKIWF